MTEDFITMDKMKAPRLEPDTFIKKEIIPEGNKLSLERKL